MFVSYRIHCQKLLYKYIFLFSLDLRSTPVLITDDTVDDMPAYS